MKDVTQGKRCRAGRRSRCSSSQPLPRRRPAHAQTEDHRGEAGPELEYEHTASSWILTKYLNNVPYGTVGGQTAIGVQAAARIFFDKPASRADPAAGRAAGGPAAGAVGVQPVPHPRAREAAPQRGARRDGQVHYITPAQAARAKARKLDVHHGTYYQQRREHFFFDYVKQELDQALRRATVRAGGLKVYTTSTCTCRSSRARRSPTTQPARKPRPPLVTMTRATATSKRWPSRRAMARRSLQLATQATASPVDVQGDRPDGRLRAGSTRHDVLRLARAHAGLGPGRSDVEVQTVRPQLSRQRQPANATRVRQHGVRAARRRHHAERVRKTAYEWASRRT